MAWIGALLPFAGMALWHAYPAFVIAYFEPHPPAPFQWAVVAGRWIVPLSTIPSLLALGVAMEERKNPFLLIVAFFGVVLSWTLVFTALGQALDPPEPWHHEV